MTQTRSKAMSENEEEKLLKNTVDEERFHVRDMVRRLGLRLSGLMFVCGTLVFSFGVFLLAAPIDSILTPRLSIIFAGALSFIGGLNILCGLLLLLGED